MEVCYYNVVRVIDLCVFVMGLYVLFRKRYEDLIKQCQTMHSSIGTGSLAYVVGSKVMDMRTSTIDDKEKEIKIESRQVSVDYSNQLKSDYDLSNNCTDMPYTCQRESSTNSADLVSNRGSTDSAAYNSCFIPSFDLYIRNSLNKENEVHGSQYQTESYFDYPSMPVMNLFEKEHSVCKEKPSTQYDLKFDDDRMHSFQINNNADLIMEPTGSPSNNISGPVNSEIEMASPVSRQGEFWSKNSDFHTEIAHKLRISDAPETSLMNPNTSNGGVNESRVSDWLWTLHRIGKSVVRALLYYKFRYT